MNDIGSKIPAKWEAVGNQLGINPGEVDAIRTKLRNDPKECIRSVFKTWKRQNQRSYTWATIIDVLRTREVDEPRLAYELVVKLSRNANQ